MHDRRVFQLFLDLRVALEAQVIAFGSEKSLKRRTMRIVAGGATVLHSRVDMGLLHFILHIAMARIAYVSTGFQCLGLIVGLMRTVAYQTIACRRRSVHVFKIGFVRMTGRANFVRLLHKQLLLSRGVRVMTRGAHAVFNRGMYIFFCAERRMARRTERRLLQRKLKRLDRFLRVRFNDLPMAGITGRGCWMNYRPRHYRAVTLCRHTALFSTGCRAQSSRYCQEQKNAHDIWET
jgi:hypothetical protein